MTINVADRRGTLKSLRVFVKWPGAIETSTNNPNYAMLHACDERIIVVHVWCLISSNYIL